MSPIGARGERTASAMETQLTALEQKIEDLLATVASPDEPRPDTDKPGTETKSNVTVAGGDHSKSK